MGTARSRVEQSREFCAEEVLDGIKLGSRNLEGVEIDELSVKWFRMRVFGLSVRLADLRVCHPEGMMTEAQIVVGVTTVWLKAVLPIG